MTDATAVRSLHKVYCMDLGDEQNAGVVDAGEVNGCMHSESLCSCSSPRLRGPGLPLLSATLDSPQGLKCLVYQLVCRASSPCWTSLLLLCIMFFFSLPNFLYGAGGRRLPAAATEQIPLSGQTPVACASRDARWPDSSTGHGSRESCILALIRGLKLD